MTTVPDPTNPFSVAHGGGTPTAGSYGTVMLTALVRLHHALQEVRLPLRHARRRRAAHRPEGDGRPARGLRHPAGHHARGPVAGRGRRLDRRRQVHAGQLAGRPQGDPARACCAPPPARRCWCTTRTTRSWFGADRLLPDLERVDHPTTDPDALQLVAGRGGAAGAGDPRRSRRGLGGRGEPRARRRAARRRRPVAVRHLGGEVRRPGPLGVPPPGGRALHRRWRSSSTARPQEAVQTVATHLARMLASRGLKDSPLFVVHEGPVSDDELLPADHVAEIRGWLESLAGDVGARQQVVIQTLDGAVRTLTRRTYPVADAAAEQVAVADRLRQDATAAYDDGRRQGARRHGGRHPAARRGAGPLAGVRRHRRAAQGAREPGGPDPRPGGQHRQGQAAAGRTGHRGRRVRPRDADPRARRGRRRARRGVVAAARARPGAARRRRHRARPGLARAAPQRRARGARVAVRRADDGPDPGPGQAHHRPVPRLRRQRARRSP